MSDAPAKMGRMDLLAQRLDDLHTQAAALVRDAASERVLERATETELAQQVAAIAAFARLAEALLVHAVGEVARRSEQAARDERMTSHLGCRDAVELVQSLTRCLLYTSPSPRDLSTSRMPSSA